LVVLFVVQLSKIPSLFAASENTVAKRFISSYTSHVRLYLALLKDFISCSKVSCKEGWSFCFTSFKNSHCAAEEILNILTKPDFVAPMNLWGFPSTLSANKERIQFCAQKRKKKRNFIKVSNQGTGQVVVNYTPAVTLDYFFPNEDGTLDISELAWFKLGWTDVCTGLPADSPFEGELLPPLLEGMKTSHLQVYGS
jgi:hypothetical protein